MGKPSVVQPALEWAMEYLGEDPKKKALAHPFLDHGVGPWGWSTHPRANNPPMT